MNQDIVAIARNTYRESIRSKILYSLIFFSAILIGLSFFFGKVTIGDELTVIKNFGLFGVSIFTMAYAAIAGTTFLHKELARKTIYNILAKPVRRSDFLLGKYFGMLFTAIFMAILMLPLIFIITVPLERQVDLLIFQALFGIILQLVIICAVAIFFSAIVITPILSGAFTVAVFFAGRSTSYLLYLLENEMNSSLSASIVNTIYAVLPHLDWLDVSDSIVYGQTQSWSHFIWSIAYSVSYSALLLILATFFFRRREFN